MYVYARINKETIKFIRKTKAVTLDYVSRITKYPSSKIEIWENSDAEKYPTIKQAMYLMFSDGAAEKSAAFFLW